MSMLSITFDVRVNFELKTIHLHEASTFLEKHNILVWEIGCPIPCKIQPNV